MPKSETWNFEANGKIYPKSLPITLSDSENPQQRFERFARCLSRCTFSCSLCSAGTKWVKNGNTEYDPHLSNSLEYKEIAIIKYEPSIDDYGFKLFDNEEYRAIFKKLKYGLDNFYRTSIIKCHDGSKSCPFFDMEYQSNFPKLIILTDKKSADKLGTEYKLGVFGTCWWSAVNIKTFCTDGPDHNFEKIIKLAKASSENLQIHNLLFQSS